MCVGGEKGEIRILKLMLSHEWCSRLKGQNGLILVRRAELILFFFRVDWSNKGERVCFLLLHSLGVPEGEI